jgi:hypothetical protein
MAANEDGDQDLLQDFFLPDDDLAHLLENSFAQGVKALDALLEKRGVLI